MKKILLFIVLLLPFLVDAQTVGYFRYDTARFYKQGGTTNLKVEGRGIIEELQLKSGGSYSSSFTIPSRRTGTIYLENIGSDQNITFPALTVLDSSIFMVVMNLNNSGFAWNVIGTVTEANGDPVTTIPQGMNIFMFANNTWHRHSSGGGGGSGDTLRFAPPLYVVNDSVYLDQSALVRDTFFVALHGTSLWSVLYPVYGARDSLYCCEIAGGGGGGNLYNMDSTLSSNRVVSMAGRSLLFQNLSGNGPNVFASGKGFDVQTNGTDPLITGWNDAASTNTAVETFSMKRTTQGTAANGIGQYWTFKGNDGSFDWDMNKLKSTFTNIGGSADTKFTITGISSAVEQDWLTLIPGYQIINNGADTVASRAYARSVGGGAGLSAINNRTYLGNVSGSTANPDTLHYSVFNVKDFGLVDDSSTDNTTAFRALLAQVPDGARIHFPGGGTGYLFNDSILINKNVKIYGDGYSFFKVYTIDNLPRRGATNLFFSAGNKNFLCLDSSLTNDNPIVNISDLTIKSTASSTPTTSNGIIIRGGVGNHMISRITITGFYNNINCVSTNNLSIEWSNILSPIQDAIILGNTKEGDYGNWHITHNNIYSGLSATTVARGIYIKGGGGIDISNNFFNAQATVTANTGFIYQIYSDFTQGGTSEVKIVNNLFDNYQTSGIKFRNYSGASFRVQNMVFIGNQFAPLYNNAGTLAAMDIVNFDNFVIDATIGNQISSTAYPVVALDSCTNVVLGSIIYAGFNARYTATANVTSLKDLSLSVTGLAGGQTIRGGTAASENLTLSSTAHATKGKINSDNLYIIGTVLSGSAAISNFLNVTGTFPATRTAETNGVAFNLTGAGSSAQPLIGVNASILAGYTGSSQTQGIASNNYSAGTGNSISGVAALAGNMGAVLGARGSSATGTNIGSYNWAYQALRNVGSVNDATLSQTNSASALSGGVVGLAKRVHSSAIEFGGYFALQATQPTFTSAALIANNSAESVPVQIWQVNGSDVAAVNAIGILNTFKGGSVASASTITPTGNSFHVTGTTTITSITTTGLVAGTVFTIIFDGALTFTDGSNLVLAGNFVTTADDTITLLYDGTNFYEQSRSVN